MPESAETISKPNLYFPDRNELLGMDMMELHQLWKQNHEAFLEFLEDNFEQIPFFGMHGAMQVQVAYFLANEPAVEVSTFFQKDVPRRLLLHILYAICRKGAHYAFAPKREGRMEPGGIVILNLEDRNKNKSRKLEGFTQRAEFAYSFDNRRDREMIEFLNEGSALDDTADERKPCRALAAPPHEVSGVIGIEEIQEFLNYDAQPDRGDWRTPEAKRTLVRRLTEQKILNSVFEKLGVY